MCCLVYFTSYVTRINYGASISEIILSLGVTKTLASMALTGSFITYGLGQILNGIIGDHIKPKTMIFGGLFITAVCNIIMSAINSVYVMTAVWCLNGLAQSMLWPPLVRIMSENLSTNQYEKACVAVSASASIATIFIYLIVPIFISFSGWRLIFLFSAFLAMTVGFIWLFSINKVVSSKRNDKNVINMEHKTTNVDFRSLFFNPGFILIMVIVLLQGVLKDGITTWMPSYLNEIFNFNTSISILSTAILPVFSILSVYAITRINKPDKNELNKSAFIWVVAFICSFILIFVFKNVVTSVIMMVIIVACMHGVNLMLISLFPARYKSMGRVSTISGIINASAYAGSAISSYGIATLSDTYGWKIIIIIWSVVALGGTILSFLCIKKWSFNR